MNNIFKSALPFLLVLITSSVSAQDEIRIVTNDLPQLEAEIDRPELASVNSRAVILGGWVETADTLYWSDDVFILDEAGESWLSLAGAESASHPYSATIVTGDALIVAGGMVDGEWSPKVWAIEDRGAGLTAFRVPDLPEALRSPTGTVEGGSIVVAGYAADGSDDIRFYRLDLTARDVWERLDNPFPFEVSLGQLTLVAQNEFLFLGINPGDGADYELYALARDGWETRVGPDGPFEPKAAIVMGGSHIAYAGSINPDSTSAPVSIFSYSTITDEWVPRGTLFGTMSELSVASLESSILSARSPSTGTLELKRSDFEIAKRHFYLIDFAMVIIYLSGMIVIGVYFSRREKGTADFFVGGRRMPWWAVGFSLYATGTSAISFMAIPAKSYATDWLYLAQNAIGLVAIIPVAMIIVPLIRRLNITSTYEYLEMRFHTAVRILGSLLNVTYQLGARMSVVLFLPALALSAVTGVGVVTSILIMGVIATVYTVLGGIKAVIWTDVVQVLVLLGGAFLSLVIIIMNIDGGVGGLLSLASADSKMHMFDWRFDFTIPTVWLFLLLATADMITWPRDQVMVQRVLSTKSDKEAGWSVWTLAAIVAPGSLLFFSLGTALWGFYKVHPEKLSPLLELDATFPFFIAAELPAGIAGIIIAALFAASMSTLDSSMNSVATIVVVDFYQRFTKNFTDKGSLLLAKWITVITGIFGTLFALILSKYSLPSLWDTFIMLTGLLGGGFGGVYALGIFSRRANWQGAFIGIISSIIVTLLAKAYTDIHVLLYVGVAVFTCIIVGYIASLPFPTQHERLRGLTVYKVDNPKVADLPFT